MKLNCNDETEQSYEQVRRTPTPQLSTYNVPQVSQTDVKQPKIKIKRKKSNPKLQKQFLKVKSDKDRLQKKKDELEVLVGLMARLNEKRQAEIDKLKSKSHSKPKGKIHKVANLYLSKKKSSSKPRARSPDLKAYEWTNSFSR